LSSRLIDMNEVPDSICAVSIMTILVLLDLVLFG